MNYNQFTLIYDHILLKLLDYSLFQVMKDLYNTYYMSRIVDLLNGLYREETKKQK